MAERLMPSGTADKTAKWTEGAYTPALMAAVTVNWRSIDKEETDAAECDKTRCSANKKNADPVSRQVLFLLLAGFKQKINSNNDGDASQARGKKPVSHSQI